MKWQTPILSLSRPLGVFCWIGLVALTGSSPSLAQDEVRFLNAKNQEERLQVTIKEESSAGITYKLNSGRTDKMAARLILDITYQVPQGQRLDYRAAGGKEREAEQVGVKADKRRKLLEEAQKTYGELISKMGDAKFAQRHLQFKAAFVLALLAEDDTTLRDAASEALARFRTDFPDCWQLQLCARQQARLKELMGNLDAVKKIYEELAGKPELDKETRTEFALLEVRLLLRTHQAAAAKAKLQAMAKEVSAKDPRSGKIQVYLAACDVAAGVSGDIEKQLTGLIAGAGDPEVKALACNTLAEAFVISGKSEEAFWLSLYVDTLYPQDREEHAKALYRLATLFNSVKKDSVRADQCLERLATDKEFAGLEIQKLAQKSRKPANP